MPEKEIYFNGNALKIMGHTVSEGIQAPNFHVMNTELAEIKLSDLKSDVLIITTFPSLDTPVCDMQIKEFNKRALSLSDTVEIIGISTDLPFAQKRFCSMNDIDKVQLFSDYSGHHFAINYGILIKDLNLLARSVFILNKNRTIVYKQIVNELTHSPNYDAVLDALKNILASDYIVTSRTDEEICLSCQNNVGILSKDDISKEMSSVPLWTQSNNSIKRIFKHSKYTDLMQFTHCLEVVAESVNHHPSICIEWGQCTISLSTHSVGGLTLNDFIVARLFDNVLREI